MTGVMGFCMFQVDLYRDTPVRYLGYANECGEAFRPLVPEIAVLATYGIAIAYVTADAISKGIKCNKESGEENGGVEGFNPS